MLPGRSVFPHPGPQPSLGCRCKLGPGKLGALPPPRFVTWTNLRCAPHPAGGPPAADAASAAQRLRVLTGVGCQKTEGAKAPFRAGAESARSCTDASWLTYVGSKYDQPTAPQTVSTCRRGEAGCILLTTGPVSLRRQAFLGVPAPPYAGPTCRGCYQPFLPPHRDLRRASASTAWTLCASSGLER